MIAEIKTNAGNIRVELDAANAPKTVENFVAYAKDGFFEGTLFHRVIQDFMIQGGGLNEDMIPKPTRDPIENEADNGLTNDRGTIAMARTADPHSASSQFFINLKDNAFLNHRAKTPDGWGYCVFGRVVEGMEVVDRIGERKTGTRMFYQDVPVDDVVIESVGIVEDAA